MRIMVCYRAFGGVAGGVQRMSSLLINEFQKRGNEVCLLTLDPQDATSFFALDEGIDWFKISVGDYQRKATFSEKIERAKAIRQKVKEFKPDLILCFQDGMYFLMRAFATGMGIPIILAERNAPHRYDHLKVGKYQNIIFQTYRFADAITIQCESFRDRYPKYLRDKIITIPNPVFRPQQDEKNNYENIRKYDKVLLSVGRLGYQKNFPPLIQAFAQIADECPEWGLVIVGEGEDRIQLEGEISRLGLSDRISLPGTIKDMGPVYNSVDLFCLPSRWEGFPNALAEALIRGVPAVGYKKSAGVCDLILDNENGILAEGNGDAASLAASLKRVMLDKTFRETLAQNASDTMMKYDPSYIYDLWEECFKKVTGKE